MGNKIGKGRQVVDDKYTRPQGLYHHKDVDHKKLRKLILDSKLAPCYPGDEDCALDLEECPICFLYYPSLNRSRCCTKGICTECFLQMKPPNSTRPTQCPFCKTPNYAVEYRGVRTKEEKGVEQLEEQRVIEAQIRMRRQELQDEEGRTYKVQEITSSSRKTNPTEAECQDLSMPTFRPLKQGDELFSSQFSYRVPDSRWPSHSRQNRETNFDLDLEEIMVMEAIWLSIQEQGNLRNPEPWSSQEGYDPSEASSPSGGLASAAAFLAEHQHMNGGELTSAASTPVLHMMQQCRGGSVTGEESYPQDSWIPNNSMGGATREEGEWMREDYGSEVAEAGTSSNTAAAAASSVAHLLPESFEEQMMLAMAVSLAEARARTSGQGVAWL